MLYSKKIVRSLIINILPSHAPFSQKIMNKTYPSKNKGKLLLFLLILYYPKLPCIVNLVFSLNSELKKEKKKKETMNSWFS